MNMITITMTRDQFDAIVGGVEMLSTTLKQAASQTQSPQADNMADDITDGQRMHDVSSLQQFMRDSAQ